MFREMLPDKLLDGDKGSGGGAGGSGGKSTTDEGTLFKTVVMVVTDPTWSSAGEPATRVCCMPVTTLAEQAATVSLDFQFFATFIRFSMFSSMSCRKSENHDE
jgi:hypothetical protein